MQRRLFLRNVACVGAGATLLMPAARVWAGAIESESVAMRLVRLSGDADGATGPVAVKVAPAQFTHETSPLRVRAWFATQAGPQAFDLASFGRTGASQRLCFQADARHLIGFEAAAGRGFDDCQSLSACDASNSADLQLRVGQYRLSLHRGDQVVATLDLDVRAAA